MEALLPKIFNIVLRPHIFEKKSFSSHNSMTQMKRNTFTFRLSQKSVPRLKFPECNNFLTETFINEAFGPSLN